MHRRETAGVILFLAVWILLALAPRASSYGENNDTRAIVRALEAIRSELRDLNTEISRLRDACRE